MTNAEQRLSQIRHAYFEDHGGAAKALKIFEAARAPTTVAKTKRQNLRRLLRHHSEGDISDAETWRRDHFDYLLAYFSMVEIACLAGWLPSRLPGPHLMIASEVLADADVRRYYEDNYPILLPKAHLRRVQGRPLAGEKSEETQALFEHFFTLSQPIETGGEVETFLWFLDGGWREEFDIDDTIDALRTPKKFLKHASFRAEDSPDGELDALSASVQGFLAFVEFAPRFLTMLREADQFPVLQSAMWHFHGYWLGQMGHYMGAEVRRALNTIGAWEIPADADTTTLQRQIADAQLIRSTQERALARLSTGRYSYVLADELLSVAGAPQGGRFSREFREFKFPSEEPTVVPVDEVTPEPDERDSALLQDEEYTS